MLKARQTRRRPYYDHPRPYGDQKMYKNAGKRKHNARKGPQKYKTIKHPRSYYDLCDHTTFPRRARHDLCTLIAFLLRSMGLAMAFTGDSAARRSHYAYEVLTTRLLRVSRLHGNVMAFLPRVHGDCKNWSDFRKFNFKKKDDVKETRFPKPWPRHIDVSDNLHLAIFNLIIR